MDAGGGAERGFPNSKVEAGRTLGWREGMTGGTFIEGIVAFIG